MLEQVEAITRQAQDIAQARAEQREGTAQIWQSAVQSLQQKFQTRAANLASMAPDQLDRAGKEHQARFAPLQRALEYVAPLVLKLRDTHYPASARPPLAIVDHYQDPFLGGGPNSFMRALMLVEPPENEAQAKASSKIAFLVYVVADQAPPVPPVERWGRKIRPGKPGQMVYSLLARIRMIRGEEPMSRELLTRYYAVGEDLKMITPESDLIQSTEDAKGVRFSSMPADHFRIEHLRVPNLRERFDPNTGLLIDKGWSLQYALAEWLSYRLSPSQATIATLYS